MMDRDDCQADILLSRWGHHVRNGNAMPELGYSKSSLKPTGQSSSIVNDEDVIKINSKLAALPDQSFYFASLYYVKHQSLKLAAQNAGISYHKAGQVLAKVRGIALGVI